MKRFYKSVEIVEDGQGHSIRLDARPVKTPARHSLYLPNRRLALAVAEEWEAQGDEIEPAGMRLTRFANTAIDRVAEFRSNVISEIAGYAGTDLVCYRAEQPENLRRRQEEGWDPVISWLDARHGVPLNVTTSLLPVEQAETSLEKIRKVVEDFDDFAVAGLQAATTATGSVVLGLALAEAEIDGEAAWELSLIDETYQIEEWGEDPDATARRENLRNEINAAARYLELCRTEA